MNKTIISKSASDKAAIAVLAVMTAAMLGACTTTAPPPEPAPPPQPAPLPSQQKLSTDNLFEFGQSSLENLSDAGRAELDAMAGHLLGGAPFEVIHVIGHSDRIGSDRANLELSTRRAASVRDYLVEKGIPADRITAVGRGSVEPLVECEDQAREALIACLAPNRRVDIQVVAAQ